MALGHTAGREVTQANLAFLNRQNFSFPPDHGARIVTTILGDDALNADWRAELEAIRTNVALRRQLADSLRDLSGSGLVRLSGRAPRHVLTLATTDEVRRLRDEHAIYMVGDGRINIAGLNPATVPTLARAIVATGL